MLNDEQRRDAELEAMKEVASMAVTAAELMLEVAQKMEDVVKVHVAYRSFLGGKELDEGRIHDHEAG